MDRRGRRRNTKPKIEAGKQQKQEAGQEIKKEKREINVKNGKSQYISQLIVVVSPITAHIS